MDILVVTNRPTLVVLIGANLNLPIGPWSRSAFHVEISSACERCTHSYDSADRSASTTELSCVMRAVGTSPETKRLNRCTRTTLWRWTL